MPLNYGKFGIKFPTPLLRGKEKETSHHSNKLTKTMYDFHVNLKSSPNMASNTCGIWYGIIF